MYYQLILKTIEMYNKAINLGGHFIMNEFLFYVQK